MKTKYSFPYVVLVIAILLVYSCTEEPDTVGQEGSLSLSFTKKDRPATEGGRVKDGDSPAFILLSISDSEGNSIITDQKIPLITIGSGYTLEDPLRLATGPKKLKKSAVLNDQNEVIYAAPTEGSQFAPLVSDALDINFTVESNSVVGLDIEVVPLFTSDDPSSFGFVTFSFDIASLPRLKSIFANSVGAPYPRQFTVEGTYQYSGNLALPQTVSFSRCLPSTPPPPNQAYTCTIGPAGHWELTLDPATKKIVSEKLFSRNVHSHPVAAILSTDWTYYADGSIETITATHPGVSSDDFYYTEHFYYKENRQLDYSIFISRTELNFPPKFIRKYTYGTDGNVSKIDTHEYTNEEIGPLYFREENLYDNHPTPALAHYVHAPYNDFLNPLNCWPRRALNPKNNVIWSRIEVFGHGENEGQSVANEIRRAYNYNEFGLPSKEIVSYLLPGQLGFWAPDEMDRTELNYSYE